MRCLYFLIIIAFCYRVLYIIHTSAEWLNYQLTPIKSLAALVLTLLISTAGGRFHFITVQGRHLFKKTTFTVSTLPRAWLEPRANRMLVMKALRKDVATLVFHPPITHSGVSRLMGLHYRSSHRRPFAIPANVFGGASNRSPRTRKASAALHRTKKIGLYFRGVAAFRSNQRGSASN